MTPRLLIDAIVQQTTVLIAQLSTAAGLRSPLAHEADQRALEDQESIEALGTLLWGAVFRSPGTSTRALLHSVLASEERVRRALASLLADGRVTRDADSDDAPLHSASFIIETGTPQ